MTSTATNSIIDPRLLEILCCPVDRSSLRLALAVEIEAINRRIALGEIRSAEGKLASAPLTDGLLRADGARIYPIRDGIPVLLPDEAYLLA